MSKPSTAKPPKERWLEEARRAYDRVTAHKPIIKYLLDHASAVKSGNVEIFPMHDNADSDTLVVRVELLLPKKGAK